jgi:hypothetical protein
MHQAIKVSKTLALAITLATGFGATAFARWMTLDQCEQQLNECANYCNSHDPAGRELCIYVCNDQYNKCYSGEDSPKSSAAKRHLNDLHHARRPKVYPKSPPSGLLDDGMSLSTQGPASTGGSRTPSRGGKGSGTLY